MTWADIKYFKPEEFDSPDSPHSGRVYMDVEFVGRLDKLRERCGFPLFITSGYRTAAHNKKVGGVDSSAHRRGYAADIRANTSATKFAIVQAALDLGFRRIGVGKTFVHVDEDGALPPRVLWTY